MGDEDSEPCVGLEDIWDNSTGEPLTEDRKDEVFQMAKEVLSEQLGPLEWPETPGGKEVQNLKEHEAVGALFYDGDIQMAIYVQVKSTYLSIIGMFGKCEFGQRFWSTDLDRESLVEFCTEVPEAIEQKIEVVEDTLEHMRHAHGILTDE